jgi:ribosomal protein L37E
MPGCRVISWDSTRTRTSLSSAASASTKSDDDINTILDEEPLVPTFILIKNMFYAAKTVHDTHIGVLFERITSTSKDDTILQSLLGRACGYGKSNRTQIFTSLETVTNYINVWTGLVKKYKLGSSITIPKEVEHSFKNKQPMAGITHRNIATGTTLGITSTRALPTSSTRAGNMPMLPTIPARVALNEDDFESEWSPWFIGSTAEDQALKWWRNKGKRGHILKKNDEGFYLCALSKGPQVLRKESIDTLRAGKKTASMPKASKLTVGETECRRYGAYANTTDKDSVCFCVHWIKRIR